MEIYNLQLFIISFFFLTLVTEVFTYMYTRARVRGEGRKRVENDL